MIEKFFSESGWKSRDSNGVTDEEIFGNIYNEYADGSSATSYYDSIGSTWGHDSEGNLWSVDAATGVSTQCPSGGVCRRFWTDSEGN